MDCRLPQSNAAAAVSEKKHPPPPPLTLRLIRDSSPDAPEPGGREGLSPTTFEELFDHAGSMLAILDDDGRFVAVNPACRRILGHDPQELLGQSLLELVKPHS